MSKNILITGASSGIGFELTKDLLAKKHNVYTLSRQTTPLEGLKTKYPTQLHIKAFDLSASNYSEIPSFIKDIPLHALVNNAGQLINKPFLEITFDDLQRVYHTNVYSIFQLIQAVFNNLHKAQGNITNITSIGGINYSEKFPGLSAYSSSKGALSVLTECLAQEFKPYNIHVNALALGAVETPMLKKAFPDYVPPTTAPQMAKYISDFIDNQAQMFNGKIIPVSNSNP